MMGREVLAFSCIALLVVGCGGNKKKSAAPAAAGTSAPVQSQTISPPTFATLEQGDQSGVTGSPPAATHHRVADDDAALTTLWDEHEPGAAAPVVDFGNERVLAVFLGDRPTDGYGIEVVGVAQITSDTLEVSYVTTQPTGFRPASATRPFHVVSIQNSIGVVSLVDVTQAAVTTPVADVHGTIVDVQLTAGGQTLAFLEDGTTEAREIVDPGALTAAGARAGHTVILSGDLESNASGATALSEAIRIASFDLDDTRLTARLETSPIGLILKDGDGNSFEPLGSLAASLAARPVDRPLRVTGRIDPTHTGTQGPGLIVTSVREATTIGLRISGGLLGLDETFTVDDLLVSGDCRYRYSLIVQAQADRRGDDTLSESARADLAGLVTAANLRAQPAKFFPTGFVVFDVPTTTIQLADKDGDKNITIQYGATLPPEITALVASLNALKQTTVKMRNLESGGFSQVTQKSFEVARTAAEWQALWVKHAGNVPGTLPPTVDFTTSIVVAAFMGRQTTGGHSIQFTGLRRDGAELRLTSESRSPAPGSVATSIITSPYQFVVVEHQGVSGDVYVDGIVR